MRLEAATDEYIQNNSLAFKNVCERLLQNQHDDRLSETFKSQQFLKGKGSNAGMGAK